MTKIERRNFIFGIAAAGLVPAAAVADENGGPRRVRIAHMTDPQFGFGRTAQDHEANYAADLARFERAVARVNALKPDLALITGDMTHRPEDVVRDWPRLLGMFEVPVAVAPGNHDMGQKVSKENRDRYLSVFGSDYRALDVKGWRIIVGNTQFWRETDLTAEKERYEAWLKDEPTAENLRLDSLMEDSLNLTLKDFATYGYRPNCRVAIYDACYNGAFHNDDCIANEYIFQPGKTICGLGGTVNVLQDKWPDRYIGLLAHGVTIGEINQLQPELEMHVVGDPTFLFANEGTSGQTPDEQSLAMVRQGSRLSDDDLLQTLSTSPYALVRLQAFKMLQERNSERLTEAIITASYDNSELLQRFAVNAMQKSGDPRLAPALARLIVQNNTSARVAFNALEVIQFFPEKAITEAVAHALDSIRPYVTWPDEYVKSRTAAVAKYTGRWAEETADLANGKMPEKRALRQADMMKIYLAPWQAVDVARYTATINDQPALQLQLLSSLGWHRLGYTHQAVSAVIEQMTHDPQVTPEVRHEAIKTLKRLK